MNLNDWAKLPQEVHQGTCRHCNKVSFITSYGPSKPEGGFNIDCLECVQKNGISTHYSKHYPEKTVKLQAFLRCRLCEKPTTNACGGCVAWKNNYCDDHFGKETPGLCNECGGWPTDSC